MNAILTLAVLAAGWSGDPAASKEELVTRIRSAAEELSSVSFIVDIREESKNVGGQGDMKPPQRRIRLSVVMATPGRFRVEAFEKDHPLATIVCDGKTIIECDHNENLWTRHVCPSTGKSSVSALLLAKDAAITRYAQCWLDKGSELGGLLDRLIAVPGVALAQNKLIKGRRCEVLTAETADWVPPAYITCKYEWLFDCDTHFPVREISKMDFTVLVQSGKDYQKNTYHDVKFNETLPPDTFVFTPSEGIIFVPPDDPRFVRPTLDGKPATEFSLSTPDGKPHSLAQAKGAKATIVVFWATWCNPCKKEIPVLVRLHKEFAAKGLAVISVSEDKIASTVQSFIKAQGIPYLVLHDPKGEAGKAYLVDGIPHTVLIDKSGVIVRTWAGGSDGLEQEIREEVAKLLKE